MVVYPATDPVSGGECVGAGECKGLYAPCGSYPIYVIWEIADVVRWTVGEVQEGSRGSFEKCLR